MASWHTLPPTPTPPFEGEPEAPQILTDLPGPLSLSLRERHAPFQDARTLHYYQDARASRGNYVVDVDGNVLLDLYGHIAALPLGYNHPALLEAHYEGRFDWCMGWRPSPGVAVPAEWVDLIGRALMRVAPEGMTRVYTMASGTEAVENAIKLAFVACAARLRGGPPTEGDLASCMTHQQPLAQDLKILSFEGAFHGRTLGSLSLTRSKPIHKVDFPAFDWPVAPFPANTFPLAEHQASNRAAEARSLERVEQILKAHGGKVAAVIVEPIQGEGGDRHASVEFFRALHRLAHQHGALVIADEVQTGAGATGRFWAHEVWGPDHAPDLVTFSKKMQLGGVYLREELFPPQAYRIFNTWLGDPFRLAQLEVVVEVIEHDHLLENVQITGALLVKGLEELATRHPHVLSNARGAGTFAAFDLPDAATRDRLVKAALRAGLEMGGSGERSIRFRPALIFAPRHAAQALGRLDTLLGGL